MKITIKIPISEKNKFKLQSRGKMNGRQFKTGAGLLESLERALLRFKSKEKIAIVVKEYIDSHFRSTNESLASQDTNYLVYITSCFLEDYLSQKVMRKTQKQYLK